LLMCCSSWRTGEKPTAEEMQRLIDGRDADKLKKARERLAQAAEPEGSRREILKIF